MRFRFIDQIVSFEKGELSRLITTKIFPSSDDFIEGFPLKPGEIPNCLILETLATSAVRLVYAQTMEKVVGILLRIEEANIVSPIHPDDEIEVHTDLLGIQPASEKSVGLARTHGRAYVSDRMVAESRLVILCFPKDGFEGAVPW